MCARKDEAVTKIERLIAAIERLCDRFDRLVAAAEAECAAGAKAPPSTRDASSDRA